MARPHLFVAFHLEPSEQLSLVFMANPRIKDTNLLQSAHETSPDKRFSKRSRLRVSGSDFIFFVVAGAMMRNGDVVGQDRATLNVYIV